MVELSRLGSNNKILFEKVKQIKATTSANAESDPDFVDLSYDPNQAIKNLKQQHKHRLSNNEITEMIRLYKTGKTVYELAEKYGCHRVTVSNILKRNGVAVSVEKSIKLFNPIEAADLYLAGMKSKDIGIRLGVSEQTIRKCLKKQGIKIRTRWDY